jgi:moderate conductance mechanosensitive channel
MLAFRWDLIGAFLLAFAVATIGGLVVRRLIRRAVRGLDTANAENRDLLHTRAKQLTRALTLALYGAAGLASVSFAIERFGFDEPEWDPRYLLHWSLTHGVNLVIVLVGAYVAIRAASIGIEHLQFNLGRRHGGVDLEWQRRAATVSGILTRIVTVGVVFVAALMVLRELTIDIVPILTGAGIVGLAVGFGAQNLVRDVISGFFLILEDQVRVGDQARINGVAGSVEQINLRTIVLRDGEGGVQVFPNGTINSLANLSKQYAYAVVEIRVAYSENMDRVIGTIKEVGESIEHDKRLGALVQAPLEIAGITSLADGAATITMKFRTHPLNQGTIANELRRRLLNMLVGRRIRPFSA